MAFENRQHQLVLLPNGLKCLFINDPESPLLSAALLVGAGSGMDPPEAPGLAHLCEHMIFLGSKQFPASGYLHFVATSADGTANAYTTGEQTCFYFEVSARTLVPGSHKLASDLLLEIFSSQFKTPLFKERHIREQINAVSEEYTNNMSDEARMLYHMLRVMANPKHPFSKFGLGNRHTLSKLSVKALKESLLKYYQTYYSSNNMVLVLKGPQSINHLRKLALTHFSDLQCGSSKEQIYQISRQGDVYQDRNQLLLVKSTMTPQLRLMYPLVLIRSSPDFLRVCNTLCNLLVDESIGSLSEYLKRKKQWVTGFVAYVQSTLQKQDVLIISLELTTLGTVHYAAIITVVQFYISRIVGMSSTLDLGQMIHKYDYVEQYRFLHRTPAASSEDEVCGYAEDIDNAEYDMRYLVRGIGPWSTSDPKEKAQTLRYAITACFRASNVSAIFISHSLPSKLDPLKDQFFRFAYTKIPLLQAVDFADPEDAELLKLPQLLLQYEMPQVSPSVVSSTTQKTRYACPRWDAKREVLIPELAFYDSNHQLWVHSLPEQPNLQRPDSMLTIHISYNQLSRDLHTLVGLELLLEILGDDLKYRLYHQELFGVFWGLFTNTNQSPSIMLSCSGTEKSLVFVTFQMAHELEVLLGSVSLLSYKTLKKARTTLRKRYEEQEKAVSMKKVFSASYLLLEEGIMLPSDKIEALEMIQVEDLEILSEQIQNTRPNISVLCTDDFSETEGRYLINLMEASSCKQPMEYANYAPSLSSYLLPEGKTIHFTMAGTQDDPVNTVLYYIQLGERKNHKDYIMAKFLEYIFSKSAFDELRTKRGLAYCVFVSIRIFRRTLGVHVMVPSASTDCETMTEEIELFLAQQEEILLSMDSETFKNEIKLPFLTNIENEYLGSSMPTSLFSSMKPTHGTGERPDDFEHSVHWSHLEQILCGAYRFGSWECQEPLDKCAIEEVTHEDFCNFFRMRVLQQSGRRASLVILNTAGELSYTEKVGKMALLIHTKLEEQGLTIDIEEARGVLQRCDDSDNFSDLGQKLKQHFVNSSQGLKFRRIALKSFAGTLLGSTFSLKSRLLSKILRSSPVTVHTGHPALEKLVIQDYREVHRKCSTVFSDRNLGVGGPPSILGGI